MKRTTLMLPAKLKAKAQREAKRQGVSLGQFIRVSMEAHLNVSSGNGKHLDPFFDDTFVITGPGPTDVAENHDKYLEQSLEEDYQRQLRDWKESRR
jgi:hypothetical protein